MNLNLESYAHDELEKLFKLTSPYTTEEVFEKEALLRSQLMQGNVEFSLKQQLNKFLTGAKQRLTLAQETIIEKPFAISTPSNIEPYIQGTFNPYERRTMTKVVNIDTIFRLNYAATSATDFHITLPESLRNVMSMKISALELPNVVETFQTASQSSSFQLTANLASGAKTATLYVPDGRYEAAGFVTAMNRVLEAQGFPFMMFGVTSRGRIFLRARLVSEGNSVYAEEGSQGDPAFCFDVEFYVEGRRPSGTAGWSMGFRRPSYSSTAYQNYETGVVYPSYLESEAMFGGAENYLFLEVDDFHNNFQTDTIQSSLGTSYIGNNLLGRIPLSSGALTVMESYRAESVFRKREYFGPVRLERLHVRLLNRHGEVVELMGHDFSFALEFEIIYS